MSKSHSDELNREGEDHLLREDVWDDKDDQELGGETREEL